MAFLVRGLDFNFILKSSRSSNFFIHCSRQIRDIFFYGGLLPNSSKSRLKIFVSEHSSDPSLTCLRGAAPIYKVPAGGMWGTILEWLYLVRCNKFIALCSAIALKCDLAYHTQIICALIVINCIVLHSDRTSFSS